MKILSFPLTDVVPMCTWVASPFYRIWRRGDDWEHKVYIAVIPLCWILRAGWNIWCFTYWWRPNRLERLVDKVHMAAYERGFDMGKIVGKGQVDTQIQSDLWKAEAELRKRQEALRADSGV